MLNTIRHQITCLHCQHDCVDDSEACQFIARNLDALWPDLQIAQQQSLLYTPTMIAAKLRCTFTHNMTLVHMGCSSY